MIEIRWNISVLSRDNHINLLVLLEPKDRATYLPRLAFDLGFPFYANGGIINNNIWVFLEKSYIHY